MLLFALAIAPGLAIVLFVIYRDKFDREPAGTLFMSFFWGAVCTIPTLFLELAADKIRYPGITGTIISTFLFVALIEEFCKFIPLRYYAFTRRSFNEPLAGIVHGVMIGMGFATLENIGYVYQYGLHAAFARMVLAVPGHAAWGVIMGYYLDKARFNYPNRRFLFLKGIFVATLFHALYDTCLFLTQEVSDSIAVLLVLGALASHVTGLILASKLLKLHRTTSTHLYQATPVLTIRNATAKDVPLIRALALQIWPQTYEKILKRQQVTYMMNLMYSDTALRKQIEEGIQFIIVYNAGLPVGFASFSEVEATVFKLHKIYILFNQQKRGVGKFAIEQVIAAIKPNGATRLILNVNIHNKAKDFYEKLGFTTIKTEDIDIGNGYFMNDYVMELLIG